MDCSDQKVSPVMRADDDAGQSSLSDAAKSVRFGDLCWPVSAVEGCQVTQFLLKSQTRSIAVISKIDQKNFTWQNFTPILGVELYHDGNAGQRPLSAFLCSLVFLGFRTG